MWGDHKSDFAAFWQSLLELGLDDLIAMSAIVLFVTVLLMWAAYGCGV